jgi:hypothetical protein
MLTKTAPRETARMLTWVCQALPPLIDELAQGQGGLASLLHITQVNQHSGGPAAHVSHMHTLREDTGAPQGSVPQVH